MCRRWGEENLIKELLHKHLIDYSPGYVLDTIEEQPMLANPKTKALKKEKALKKTELHKLKVQLADKVLIGFKDTEEREEAKRAQFQIVTNIAKIDNEILQLDMEIGKLPKQVRFDEAHDGKKLLQHNHEKKRFLDCIKVFAYNIEKIMCELLLKHYGNKKEILPALSMIVNRAGYLILEGNVLKVRLRRFKNREIDYAARHLCDDLNAMRPVTLDKFRFRVEYRVE